MNKELSFTEKRCVCKRTLANGNGSGFLQNAAIFLPSASPFSKRGKVKFETKQKSTSRISKDRFYMYLTSITPLTFSNQVYEYSQTPASPSRSQNVTLHIEEEFLT